MHRIKTHGRTAANRRAEPADAALWRAWQAGQTEELRQAIAGMHFGIVLQEARWADRSASAVLHEDDLIDAGVRGLYHAVNKYDPARPEPFSGFARAVVRTRMLNASTAHRRRQRRCSSLSATVDGGAELGDLVADPRPTADQVDGDEWSEAFAAVTAPLDRRGRLLVRMHFVDGRTAVEIADTFTMTVDAVRAGLAAAIDAIRDAFTVDEIEQMLGVGLGVPRG